MHKYIYLNAATPLRIDFHLNASDWFVWVFSQSAVFARINYDKSYDIAVKVKYRK